MIKSAVARTPILAFILMFFALGYTVAHNKVVVVPLGSTESTLDIYRGTIANNGSLVNGNLLSATRPLTGNYVATIPRSVEGCTAVGSAGGGSGSGGTDTFGTVSTGFSSETIVIRNRRFSSVSNTMVASNSSIQLIVICPKT